MTMPWFRMYHESRNDRKLDVLADDEFRVWHRLLCFASESAERGTVAADDRMLLAIEVARGDEALLERTIKRLIQLKILANDAHHLTFINFVKRNYDKPSDTPQATAERKRKQRVKEREEAGQGRDTGVTDAVSRGVTPSHAIDTDTDVDPEEIQTQKERGTPPIPPTPIRPVAAPPDRPAKDPPGFVAFWQAWPKKEGRAKALAAWKSLRMADGELDDILAAIPRQQSAKDWPRENWRYCPLPATWLNQRRWEDEVPEPVPEGRALIGKDRERAEVMQRVLARRGYDVSGTHPTAHTNGREVSHQPLRIGDGRLPG